MLYAFGSNGSAQLGVGHTEDLSAPQPISTKEDEQGWKVKQFAAGGNHTVLLCDDDNVRVTGNNEDGRCGIQGIKQLTRFEELVLPSHDDVSRPRVVHVAANWSTTTLVLDDGTVRTCGTGNSGELGLGRDVETTPSLQSIPSFPPVETDVVDIASGMGHTVAVLSNGEVYGWGKGRKGQLGELAQDTWEPRKVEGVDFKAIKAVCGKDFTFLVGEASVGQVTLFGPRGADRFGIKSNAPETLEGWMHITASWCSVHVLNAIGDVVSWGRNDHGQLPPLALPKIRKITAGSEHCLAVTRAGKALAWGWGEHGNCGTPTDTRGDVKARSNEIGVPGRVTQVFAGCATSFIETEEPGADEGDDAQSNMPCSWRR